MRFFFVAIAETRSEIVESITRTIREWNTRLDGRLRVGVLVRYTKWRRRECLPCKYAREYDVPVIIDNGAFTFLTASSLEGRLDPFTLARWRTDYALWLSANRDMYDKAVMPDIPVHGRRFLGERERRARIELSALNQRLFLELYGGILPVDKLVPVIQGFTVEEYEYSYELLRSSGLLNGTAYTHGDYEGVLGVGSVCVRKWSSKRMASTIAGGKAAGTLNKWLPVFLSKCCRSAKGFHFFGLHSRGVRAFGRHPRFHASDSGAHGYSYKYRWRTLGCRAFNTPECAQRIVGAQLERVLKPFLPPGKRVLF